MVAIAHGHDVSGGDIRTRRVQLNGGCRGVVQGDRESEALQALRLDGVRAGNALAHRRADRRGSRDRFVEAADPERRLPPQCSRDQVGGNTGRIAASGRPGLPDIARHQFEGSAGAFLDLRQALVGVIAATVRDRQGDGAGDEHQAQRHGDHQFDQRQAALAGGGCMEVHVHRPTLRSISCVELPLVARSSFQRTTIWQMLSDVNPVQSTDPVAPAPMASVRPVRHAAGSAAQTWCPWGRRHRSRC